MFFRCLNSDYASKDRLSSENSDTLINNTQNWLPQVSELCCDWSKMWSGRGQLTKAHLLSFLLEQRGPDLVLWGDPSSVPWDFCRGLGRCYMQAPPGGGARHQNCLTWRTSGHHGSCPSGKGGTSGRPQLRLHRDARSASQRTRHTAAILIFLAFGNESEKLQTIIKAQSTYKPPICQPVIRC